MFASFTLMGQEIHFKSNSRLVLGVESNKSASVSAGDIDNDGDIDIVVANGRHWPQTNNIFINNGFGKFTVAKSLDNNKETSYATELADIDSDGDLDIIVGNDMAPNAIYFNDGVGNFLRSTYGFGEPYSSTRNIKTTDVDADGDIDIVITNRGKENEICLNNGKGVFFKSIKFGSNKDATIDVDVVDINKDGYKDLIVANRNKQQNFIYLNNGKEEFSTKIPFGSGSDETRSLGVADIDNDGVLDIITQHF